MMIDNRKLMNDNELDQIAGGSALDDAVEAFNYAATLGNPNIYSGGNGMIFFY